MPYDPAGEQSTQQSNSDVRLQSSDENETNNRHNKGTGIAQFNQGMENDNGHVIYNRLTFVFS